MRPDPPAEGDDVGWLLLPEVGGGNEVIALGAKPAIECGTGAPGGNCCCCCCCIGKGTFLGAENCDIDVVAEIVAVIGVECGKA